jgi:hypothetical protein
MIPFDAVTFANQQDSNDQSEQIINILMGVDY